MMWCFRCTKEKSEVGGALGDVTGFFVSLSLFSLAKKTYKKIPLFSFCLISRYSRFNDTRGMA